ncbi:MAG: LicD family protein [Bacillota bacterium]|nr:LicD family protein [Bacillota bacterium]
MNELQETLYNMLVEFDSICEQTEVKYYLAGGTALGAVRNHCFLPWDDDIDIYITHENWKKLRKALEDKPELIPEGRDFVYKENTEYYCNPIVRYVNKNTTSIMKSQILAARACGQAIELLIMNPMPADESRTEEYLRMLKVYTELLSPYFLVNKHASINDYEIHLKLCREYYKLCDEIGKEAVLKKIEDEYLSFPEKECERFCMLWGISTLIYEKKNYGNGRRELFEDTEFFVGENAEGIFRVAYGDSWMYIPEISEQDIHEASKDLNTPFEKYTSKYLPEINREEYYGCFERKKRNVLEAFIYTLKLRKVEAEAQKIVAEMHIAKEKPFDKEQIALLLDEGEYEKLNDIFEYYYSRQLDSELRKNEMLIEVGDDIIHFAISNLINQGKYYNGNKILKLRKKRGALTEALEEDEKIIEFARNISIAIYDLKDTEKVRALLAENKDYSWNIEWQRGNLWMLAKMADSEGEWENVKGTAEKALYCFEFDGEIMSFLAQALYYLGKTEEGKKIGERSVEKTRNAFAWERVKTYYDIDRISREGLNSEVNLHE